MSRIVYTIGHSNGTMERLLGLLHQHGITAVADVRSRPYSRFNPQFNREELAGALRKAGLGYVFLGDELGARSEDPACYRGGRAQYALIARTPALSVELRACRKEWTVFAWRSCAPRKNRSPVTARF